MNVPPSNHSTPLADWMQQEHDHWAAIADERGRHIWPAGEAYAEGYRDALAAVLGRIREGSP